MTGDTGYFLDGTRKIHYVLVAHEENLTKLDKFISNLKQKDIDTEIAAGTKLYYLIFILLHLPKRVHQKYSKIYNIGQENERIRYTDVDILKYFHFKKLRELPKTEQRDLLTNAQCIIILNKILEKTSYGDDEFDYSLSKLVQTGILTDAYPLHDGSLKLSFNDYNDETIKTCNERELLYRYWASFRVWHYQIPLDLIKTYYGHEIAFFFHWLEYFNLMLFPIAMLGSLVIIINIILIHTTNIYSVEEVCNNQYMYLCPSCILKLFCYYKPVKEYCELYAWTYVFDNHLTVFFAILISFWATFFLNIWVRRTKELQLRWGIQAEDHDESIRREYAENVKRYRLNEISGKLEPSMSLYEKAARYTFVVLVCSLVFTIDVLMIFGVFYFEMILKMFILLSPMVFTKSEKKGVVTIASSFLLVVVIKIKSKLTPILLKWLTKICMHKTQKDFDKSLIYKRYIMSFCNNYTVLFYTAFLKGAFYTTPNSKVTTHIARDSCQPLPCITDLASQVFFIMLFRRLLWNIIRLLPFNIHEPFKFCFTRKRDFVPQYEEEYWLKPTTRDFLCENYNEMIIEYGMVTFFSASFPLAPLFALLDNILEMRIIARKLIKKIRRPIPRIVPGIGPWQGILMGLMYFSTAINAYVIAFSTRFVSREVFMYKYNSHLKGFLNYTLSEFATEDNEVYDTIKDRRSTCYYMGMREPPNSSNKYKLTTEFWSDFTWKLVFLVSFEHIVLMLNALLSFAIRDVPQIVRDHIAYDRYSVREAQIKLTKEQEQCLFLRFRGRAH